MTEQTSGGALPKEVRAAPTVQEAARLLGDALGLEGPAPLPATERALADPLFARALMGFRKLPHLRDPLLNAPEALRIDPQAPSSAEVLKKVAGSMLKWGMEGLKPADPWVISKRIAACNTCDFQAPAPETLVYRGAKVVAGKDAKICRSCMCLTNTKAAISTELCPEQNPDDPTRSRWDEPWVAPQEHPDGPW